MPAMNNPDTLHYVRIPGGQGGRAEMVRMVYALAGRPYVDALHGFEQVRAAIADKSPFRQVPLVETADGETIYQSLAIMHHAANGTAAWPSEPAQLTRALAVAMGAYDLYQAFGGFSASDAVAREKFEQRRAPQYLDGLATLYAQRPFAAGEVPCFADCVAHQAIAWCARRNEVARALLAERAPLVDFMARFEQVPAIAALMQRQREARAVDDAV
jgi:glutathione S-transferase